MTRATWGKEGWPYSLPPSTRLPKLLTSGLIAASQIRSSYRHGQATLILLLLAIANVPFPYRRLWCWYSYDADDQGTSDEKKKSIGCVELEHGVGFGPDSLSAPLTPAGTFGSRSRDATPSRCHNSEPGLWPPGCGGTRKQYKYSPHFVPEPDTCTKIAYMY